MENQNKVFLVFSEMLQYFHFIICILIFHLTEHKKYLAQLRNDTDIAPHKTGKDYYYGGGNGGKNNPDESR